MNRNIKDYNEMINKAYLGLWRRKTESELDKCHFDNFPIKLLDISEIYNSLITLFQYNETTKTKLIEKLIDIKTLYFFLDNSLDRFYLGTTLIVGNGELEKVDEKTFSLIQLTHYKVYLISCLYEKLLDLFELIYFGNITEPKKDKWGKLFDKISEQNDFDCITSDDNKIMLNFREKVRRSEIHGISTVIRQLYKNKWDHFSTEEEIVKKISQTLHTKFKTITTS